MVDQRVQTVGPDTLVDEPVAQAGLIIAPVQEPTVVQDEALDAYLGAKFAEASQNTANDKGRI